MMKINWLKFVLPIAMMMTGCNDSNPNTKADNTVQVEHAKTEVIKQVNIHDDDGIIKSSGRDVVHVNESEDIHGQPKKIYKLDQSSIGTQVEISKNELVVAWWNLADDAQAVAQSKQNRSTVIKILSAIWGADASNVITQIESGNFVANSIPHAKSGTCISGLCIIKFSR